MNVNILYRVTGQRTEQIAGNDEKHQMKTSRELCAFPANIGLRVAKGERFSTVIRREKKKQVEKDGLLVYTHRNDHCRSTALTEQRPFHRGPHSDFLVKGFVTIITAFLENNTFCSFGHIRRQMVVKCKLVGEYLSVRSQDKTCVCTPEREREFEPNAD